MKLRWGWLIWVLTWAGGAAATPITGALSIAGLDTFNSTAISFQNPGFVLFASGTLGPLGTSGFPQVDMTSFHYATAGGVTLFDWNHVGLDVHMTIVNLTLVQELGNFLNIAGTAQLTETGETPVDYAFTLTSTHPDGLTSYTMDLVPVPEPIPLALVGLGLSALAGLLFFDRRARSSPSVQVTHGTHVRSHDETSPVDPLLGPGGQSLLRSTGTAVS